MTNRKGSYARRLRTPPSQATYGPQSSTDGGMSKTGKRNPSGRDNITITHELNLRWYGGAMQQREKRKGGVTPVSRNVSKGGKGPIHERTRIIRRIEREKLNRENGNESACLIR